MKSRPYLKTAVAVLLSALSAAAYAADTAKASGILVQNIDPAVRPQDDFYSYANGKWQTQTAIPDNQSQIGAFGDVRDITARQLRAILDSAASDPGGDADRKRLGDFYASYLDEARAEQLGLDPLRPMLAEIERLNDRSELPALIARFNRYGWTAPIATSVHLDYRDTSKYVLDFAQAGLALPDRDYYLKADDAKLAGLHAAYRDHVAKMLALAGIGDAAAKAAAIDAIEQKLAAAQWSKQELRDPEKLNNATSIAQLATLMPHFDWRAYLKALGADGKASYVNIGQPSYFRALDKVLADTPLQDWRAYFQWQLLRANAAYLSKQFADTNFAFFSTTLNGARTMRPREERAVAATDNAMSESLGKLYVAKHFPPEHKARAQVIVDNVLRAFGQSIDGLDWMSDATKTEARAKLSRMRSKIGYPSKWRSYSGLQVSRNDLVGNVMRAKAFNFEYDIAKLGGPVDREAWDMPPQLVTAYYSPELNEVVFPASVLQPPFFDPNADDAVNYGAIGGSIGHEVSHAFDDEGSKYDGNGVLRDWWTKEDGERFRERTSKLVAQYDQFSPLPGYHLNGTFTLGENIGDNSGLSVAWKAYQIALGGQPAPVIDGTSGAQRFLLGWAQIWRLKYREARLLTLLKMDEHPPGQFRVNGVMRNLPVYYEAYGVKPGDAMYLPPEQRVKIW